MQDPGGGLAGGQGNPDVGGYTHHAAQQAQANGLMGHNRVMQNTMPNMGIAPRHQVKRSSPHSVCVCLRLECARACRVKFSHYCTSCVQLAKFQSPFFINARSPDLMMTRRNRMEQWATQHPAKCPQDQHALRWTRCDFPHRAKL
jgi:hypothetical protein